MRKYYYKIRTLLDWRMMYRSARSIPTMSDRFKRWRRWNPEISDIFDSIAEQILDYQRYRKYLTKYLKTHPECGSIAQEFARHENGIRQSFSDITDLLIIAGAPCGRAASESVAVAEIQKDLQFVSDKLGEIRSLLGIAE